MINYFSRISLALGLCALFIFSACQEENIPQNPTPTEKDRTVLMYLIVDPNMWNFQKETVNNIEKGWSDDTNGNFLVYIAPSSPQDPSKFTSPVLLKIRHDESEEIRSEIIKTYPEQDPADTTVMKNILNDVRLMYPAKSHGLILFSHGTAWIPEIPSDIDSGMTDEDLFANMKIKETNKKNTRVISGSDQYGTNLEVNDLAKILPIKYDFLIHNSCLMGNIETAYELRNTCSEMVACMLPLPGQTFPYDEVTQYLYTKPQADLSKFCQQSVDWYQRNIPKDTLINFNVSLIQTDRLEELASATHRIMERFAEMPNDFYLNFYQNVKPIDLDLPLYDLNQVVQVGFNNVANQDNDYIRFHNALQATVECWGMTKNFNPQLANPEECCGLSCYIPQIHPVFDFYNGVFRNSYSWSKASGFTLPFDALLLP